MKCAAGPWYRSEDRPPPKDGTLILGIFAGHGVELTSWDRLLLADDDDTPCWVMSPLHGIEEDPVVWAKVEDYDGEVEEKTWIPFKRRNLPALATGPWIRSKDKPPPKDGRPILAVFAEMSDEILIARWRGWTEEGYPPVWYFPVDLDQPDDPIAWAEIRPYQKEGDER